MRKRRNFHSVSSMVNQFQQFAACCKDRIRLYEPNFKECSFKFGYTDPCPCQRTNLNELGLRLVAQRQNLSLQYAATFQAGRI